MQHHYQDGHAAPQDLIRHKAKEESAHEIWPVVEVLQFHKMLKGDQECLLLV
jgi:hypothetical protein